MKITDDLDVLLVFFDYLAEHWVHVRTTNPIESTFATVRSTPPTWPPVSEPEHGTRKASSWNEATNHKRSQEATSTSRATPKPQVLTFPPAPEA